VLVSLGGDVAVAGEPPIGGWSIQLADDHAAPPDGPGPVVAIHSGGLATSGTTVRRWRSGRIELHHIVDPRTGRPAVTPWRTVSVAAASCVDANIASTAAILLGPAAEGWLLGRQLPARLVDTAGATVRVAGWPSEAP
jgi:thiamine biosynthesis lipoprotein